VHLAGVYDGSSMILYRNGVEIARRSHTGAMPNQTSPLVAGGGDNGAQGGFGEYVDAVLDDVRIYNRALSGSEVQALFAQGGGSASPMLVSSSDSSGSRGSCGLLGIEILLLIGLGRLRRS
ncbi:MAG: LamG domain-containing protein, partial [Acidobacteria bacterium]|nr:LamG domain-containing protein [Acidobacteriota bacterium]